MATTKLDLNVEDLRLSPDMKDLPVIAKYDEAVKELLSQVFAGNVILAPADRAFDLHVGQAKDNKIRFDTPNVIYMGIESLNDEFKFSMPRVLITGTTLFTQKGKVLEQKIIDSFDKFINDLIISIIASTNADDEW